MTAITREAVPAPRGRSASPADPVRRRGRRHRAAAFLACLAVLAVLAVLSLAIGSVDLDPRTVLAALFAFDGSNDHVIVAELRVPRTIIAIVVGAALGLAGTLMQGLTRNPLAEPGILGVNAGAALGIVIGLAVFGLSQVTEYIWSSFAGAALASLAVYALGHSGPRHVSPVRLILAGAVLAAILGSISGMILILDIDTLNAYRFWSAGSVAGRDLDGVAVAFPLLGLGVVLGIVIGRQLDTLSLGDDVARSLGQPVTTIRLVGGLAEVLLTGAAVAIAGPIIFVGLVAPHAARALVGPDYRWITWFSLVLGACLVLVADTLGRVLLRPSEVEVGIMTALLGAPIFIMLVRRRNLEEI